MASPQDPAPSATTPAAPDSPVPASGPEMTTILVADDNIEENDGDSTYGSVASSSTSLASSILRLRQENGRKYHSYKAEKEYILPSDEQETDRLDLQHYIFCLTFDNQLYTCPAGRDGKPLNRVFDAGTGTGIWAMDFADEHPEAHVIGVDLSPIQPSFVPPNVNFYVDDLEDEWTYSEPFDFIYARMLTGGIADFPKFMERSFENLRPGGWLEFADITFPAGCDDGTLPADSAILKWNTLALQAADTIGRSIESGKKYKEQMEEAGFVNVVEKVYKWPINPWPKDARYKEIGAYTEINIGSGLYGLSVALFTRVLGWSIEELEVLLAGVRKELSNRHIHAYWPIWVVYGQKPEDGKKPVPVPAEA
ncbi:hypothetical protein VTJ83DRAFT_2918 [Remersonia thermophila]|uniref:Methyltransferase n=1 Tax=Remersonia thermophila TaxID=72144 RepID=A0ABR4DCK0_9PEZI